MRRRRRHGGIAITVALGVALALPGRPSLAQVPAGPPAASPPAADAATTQPEPARPTLSSEQRARLKADFAALIDAYGRDDHATALRLAPTLIDLPEVIDRWDAVRVAHLALASARAAGGENRPALGSSLRAAAATVLATPADADALFEAAFRLALYAHDAGDRPGEDAAIAWGLEIDRRADLRERRNLPNLQVLAMLRLADTGRFEAARAMLARIDPASQTLLTPAQFSEQRAAIDAGLTAAGTPACQAASDADGVVACLRQADRLRLAGEPEAARALLAGLAKGEATTASGARWPAERLPLIAEATEAAIERDGWRAMTTVEAVADLGHFHAGQQDAAVMGIHALRLAAADLAAGQSSARAIDLFGHVARRYVRQRDEQSAGAMLALMERLADGRFLPPSGYRPGSDADDALRRATLAALIRLDRAMLAERRGQLPLADWLRARAAWFIASVPQAKWGLMLQVSEPYSSDSVGFSYPSEATTAEFWALAAPRRPRDDLLHFGDRMYAAISEGLVRENRPRSIRLLTDLVADMRARADLTGEQKQQLLQAMQALGQGHAELGDNRSAAQWRRQAYDLARTLPGEENLLVELMLELRADALAGGDRALAMRLLNEADRIRNAGARLSASNISSLDEALAIYDYNRGAKAQGIARMRKSLAELGPATVRNAGARAIRAASLAKFEAASGNIEAARRLYDEIVLPHYGRAARFGDLTALDNRLAFLRLAARYQPKAETVEALRKLRNEANSLVPGARTFHQSIEATAAMAELAAGDPKQALASARKAIAMEAPEADAASIETDRLLRETLIEAAWAARERK